MRPFTTDHLDAARAENAYRNAIISFKNKNEALWHTYMLASLPVAAQMSTKVEDIAEFTEQLADELLRKHRLGWEQN